MLAQARHVVNVCQAETRRAVWNIRQPGLEGASLRSVLEKVVAELPEPRATEVALSVGGPPRPLSAMLEHELGHIVREAVINALRHASATRIAVEARAEDDGIRVAVKDDGRGLPERPPADGDGIGIIGMRERASRIGATLELVGAPGGGTEVRLHVPAGGPPRD
jgi:signal transduction histidine kinase